MPAIAGLHTHPEKKIGAGTAKRLRPFFRASVAYDSWPLLPCWAAKVWMMLKPASSML